MRYLCCDLGGTTANWAVFDEASNSFIFQSSPLNSSHEDFYAMMDFFLAAYGEKFPEKNNVIENTTFAVAGHTDHTKVRPTNIKGWEVNIVTANSILIDHGHHGYSSIINDFEALGYGILFLYERGISPEDVEPILGRLKFGPARQGQDVSSKTLVCGPGTGLGIACLVDGLIKDGFPYIFSSEGGHRTFAPETVDEYRYLSEDGVFQGKQSYENLLSHNGMREIYNYFRREDYSAEPNYSISSQEIIMLAGHGQDQAATDTIEMFCEALANFCGNEALTFNCDKAVFLWGGTLKNLPIELLKARFKRHYGDRVNFSDRISAIPVVLLRNQETALLGCVHRSRFEVEHMKPKKID